MIENYLEKIYSEVLNEAILDQSSFLQNLMSIVNNKSSEDKESNTTPITNNIRLLIDRTKLFDLKGKENKKARKKAEILIHKKLKKIKGINGTPIDLKLIRPFYDSIIKFLEEKDKLEIPVSLVDDAIKVSDYYMKEFYKLADKNEKEVIDKGKFKLDTIFKRTKFYQRYLDFKTNSKKTKTSLTPVYEDDNIEIVFPNNSSSFNKYIRDTNSDVDWCTQSPGTWLNYNSRQHVMIINVKSLDPEDEDYLISLKVKFNGDIDASGTCNYYNEHMGDDIYEVLSPEVCMKIKNLVSSGELKNKNTTNTTKKFSEILGNAKNLIDLNRYDEVRNIMHILALTDSENSDEGFELTTRKIFRYAISKKKMDKVLHEYVEVISILNFDNLLEDEDIEWQNPLRLSDEGFSINKTKQMFALHLLNLSLKKGSHERYFITLLELYRLNLFDWIRSLGNPIELISQSLKEAIKTNTHLNFSRVINLCLEHNDTRNLMLIEKTLNNVMTSKGFSSLLMHKKVKIVNSFDSQKFSLRGGKFVPGEYFVKDCDEYLTIAVLANKDTFSSILQEKDFGFDCDDVDKITIMNFINQEIGGNKDLLNISDLPIRNSLFNVESKEVKNIFIEFTKDLEFFKYYDINNQLSLSIFKYFCSKNFILENTSLHNANAYELFSYVTSVSLKKQPYHNYAQSILESSNYLFKGYMRGDDLSINSFNVLSTLMKVCFNKKPNSYSKDVELLMNKVTKEIVFDPFSWNDTFSMIIENNLHEYKVYAQKNNQQYKIINYIKKLSIRKDFDDEVGMKKITRILMSIPEVKTELLSNLNNRQLFLSDLTIMFLMYEDNLLTKENANVLFTKYINFLYSMGSFDANNSPSSENSSIVRKLQKISDIVGKMFEPNISAANSLTRKFINKETFLLDANLSFRYLFYLLTKKFNKNNISLDKKAIKELLKLDKFSYVVDKSFKKELFENFITTSSSNTKNILNMKERAIVRDTLISGLRKGNKNLTNDYELMLRFVKQLDSISKRHMYLAFPNEKELNIIDLDEALLKLYLRLLIN